MRRSVSDRGRKNEHSLRFLDHDRAAGGAGGVGAAPAIHPVLTVTSGRVAGWGEGRGAAVRVVRPARVDDCPAALEWCRARGEMRVGAITRGMGRSYGDAAQLDGGLVLETRRLKRFELDPEGGTVQAEAGVTLGELLATVVPAGWMVPVVPGTQHVSVGGAIAGDIHGKNHGIVGTFGAHVEALGLLTAVGEVLELTPADPVFGATLGGMGLTGVILWARIRLRHVDGPWLSVDTDRVDGLDQALAALREPGGSHRVAWLDLLGPRPCRGVVTRAEHLPASGAPSGVGESAAVRERSMRQRSATAGGRPGSATVDARATVPAGWPAGLLRPVSVRAFNELRFRRSPRAERGAIESIGAHMFPLDALDRWPRLYGEAGLVQYQLVVPYGAERVLEQVIEELRRARVPCYLAVLKDFGEANWAPLSFPIAGWTLALDIPRAAPGLSELLDRFDRLVAEAGGRVYLSKDARMRPDALAAMYPRLDEWREVRDSVDPDGVWRSDLAERTGLVGAGDAAGASRGSSAAPGAGRAPSAAGASGAARTPGAARAPGPTAARAPAPTAANRVLLIGGSSEIGLAIVRRLAADNPVQPYLIGRDRDRLSSALAELERSGCSGAQLDLVDAEDLDGHAEVIARAFARCGGFETVVLAIGVLGGQAGLDADRDEALEVMRVNFAGTGSLLLEAMRQLRDQGSGTLVVLSTVAAERPRASNAIYGAAKAGLDSLAHGLADATAGSGVRVLVVRPGFVTTRMTEGLEPAPMATTPEAVADATVRALGTSAHTVWVPDRLRLVFAVLRHLPRAVFRRLPL